MNPARIAQINKKMDAPVRRTINIIYSVPNAPERAESLEKNSWKLPATNPIFIIATIPARIIRKTFIGNKSILELTTIRNIEMNIRVRIAPKIRGPEISGMYSFPEGFTSKEHEKTLLSAIVEKA